MICGKYRSDHEARDRLPSRPPPPPPVSNSPDEWKSREWPRERPGWLGWSQNKPGPADVCVIEDDRADSPGIVGSFSLLASPLRGIVAEITPPGGMRTACVPATSWWISKETRERCRSRETRGERTNVARKAKMKRERKEAEGTAESGKWQATVIGRPKTRRLEAQYANYALKRDICASRGSPRTRSRWSLAVCGERRGLAVSSMVRPTRLDLRRRRWKKSPSTCDL